MIPEDRELLKFIKEEIDQSLETIDVDLTDYVLISSSPKYGMSERLSYLAERYLDAPQSKMMGRGGGMTTTSFLGLKKNRFYDVLGRLTWEATCRVEE